VTVKSFVQCADALMFGEFEGIVDAEHFEGFRVGWTSVDDCQTVTLR
jgi:hypothetical protein